MNKTFGVDELVSCNCAYASQVSRSENQNDDFWYLLFNMARNILA